MLEFDTFFVCNHYLCPWLEHNDHFLLTLFKGQGKLGH